MIQLVIWCAGSNNTSTCRNDCFSCAKAPFRGSWYFDNLPHVHQNTNPLSIAVPYKQRLTECSEANSTSISEIVHESGTYRASIAPVYAHVAHLTIVSLYRATRAVYVPTRVQVWAVLAADPVQVTVSSRHTSTYTAKSKLELLHAPMHNPLICCHNP